MTKEDVLNFLQSEELELKSTHKVLSFPIIYRLYRKMLLKIQFTHIKVDDELIIDGHHRYLASKLAKSKELERVKSHITDAKEKTDWKNVEIVDSDWDAPESVKTFNEEDAKYNNMTLEKLEELLEKEVISAN